VVAPPGSNPPPAVVAALHPHTRAVTELRGWSALPWLTAVDSLAQAIEVVGDHRPDAVVLDVVLLDSVEGPIRHLLSFARPPPVVVMCGVKAAPSDITAAVRAGAAGYVDASMTPEQLTAALRAATRGALVAPKESIAPVVMHLLGDDRGLAQ
jgi:DNA-binding NarL/FixJ family response regulator